ncbi:FliA/WhiG family RNA polymerase sigma factor [Bacillus sp. SM2101]|uniref:FliA/WhiG family RNA polymerase sigma factor n=1 Tax=Bacillus sp. SM2101 TaxID=2805366 RepID=UPI001BDE72DC|nr:FliA/WhiG family RNA polymerase sigma factor [Bacillus sp. SM2101]
MALKLESEDQLLWEKWVHTRDENAGNALVKKYMPLVMYHVQRISVGLPKTVNLDDVKSYGLFGLFDALEKFDTSRDLKFDTYASFRIKGAILDGLRKEDWMSRSAREKAKKLEATTQQLEQQLLRNVTADEIANELNINVVEVYSTIQEGFFANVLSMDEHNKESEEKDPIAYTIVDKKSIIPEEQLLKNELVSQLVDVLKELNEKEQLVISLFYKEELTLTEIGEVMGLSTSRISQIHSKALFKLKGILTKIFP